ncbi:Alanine racemase [hydrothermal vent metagenome]|uniref:Alanine racemase n=1 Tax=hydrothermal vent metagenome TaxID=652676 RepID=A0A3B0W3K6_9ZZZZ
MFYRPAKAYIYLPALRHNLNVAKSLAPNSKILAVVKANGYGHGICRVAQQLVNADAFGVASMDEALQLRQKGFLHRILLLEGVFSEIEMPLAIQNRLDIVVHSEHQLQWLLDYQTAITVTVWLKIDTGMHRLGFSANQIPFVVKRLEQHLNPFNIHLMSHFASADELSSSAVAFTRNQINIFNQVTEKLEYPKSLNNSAGLQSYRSSSYDWVRPGILLYGAGQVVDTLLDRQTQLKPVMRLESEVIAIKWVKSGEFVGYGNDWQASKDTCIAVIAIGYGDGYPRHAVTGTPVLVDGKRVPLIGRVSMDMITVDITKYSDEITIGSLATLWGGGLSIDEVAKYANTISYELLCGITSRVPMIEVQ